jgi:hypothetical protein
MSRKFALWIRFRIIGSRLINRKAGHLLNSPKICNTNVKFFGLLIVNVHSNRKRSDSLNLCNIWDTKEKAELMTLPSLIDN